MKEKYDEYHGVGRGNYSGNPNRYRDRPSTRTYLPAHVLYRRIRNRKTAGRADRVKNGLEKKIK